MESPSHTTDTRIRPEDESIIENLLPCEEVHLFAGPSGAGKTTLLLQLIPAWQRGEPVFGHRSFPLPFVYVSCDRSNKGVKRTLRRVGVNPENFPFIAALNDPKLNTLEAIFLKIKTELPDVKVIFIEGIAKMVPKGKTNDYYTVANFLTGLTRACEEKHFTIIGIVHSSKTKKNEQYENPRERVLGSVAWAAYSETIIGVEPVNISDPTSKMRRVYLMPRNSPSEEFRMQFDSRGLLAQVTGQKDALHPKFLAFLRDLDDDGLFTTTEALQELRGVLANLSRATIFRNLRRAKERGIILAVDKHKSLWKRAQDDPLDMGIGSLGSSDGQDNDPAEDDPDSDLASM